MCRELIICPVLPGVVAHKLPGLNYPQEAAEATTNILLKIGFIRFEKNINPC